MRQWDTKDCSQTEVEAAIELIYGIGQQIGRDNKDIESAILDATGVANIESHLDGCRRRNPDADQENVRQTRWRSRIRKFLQDLRTVQRSQRRRRRLLFLKTLGRSSQSERAMPWGQSRRGASFFGIEMSFFWYRDRVSLLFGIEIFFVLKPTGSWEEVHRVCQIARAYCLCLKRVKFCFRCLALLVSEFHRWFVAMSVRDPQGQTDGNCIRTEC